MIGPDLVGIPAAMGFGVYSGVIPPEGSNGADGRVGCAQKDHFSPVRCPLGIGGKSGDVVAAADHEGNHRMILDTLHRQFDGLHDQPGTGQIASVPAYG